MSVNNLRSIITERGFSTIGVLTWDELVARAEEAMAAPQLPTLDEDRLKFAGPLAGPGVVRWSVKPNRSPDHAPPPALV